MQVLVTTAAVLVLGTLGEAYSLGGSWRRGMDIPDEGVFTSKEDLHKFYTTLFDALDVEGPTTQRIESLLKANEFLELDVKKSLEYASSILQDIENKKPTSKQAKEMEGFLKDFHDNFKNYDEVIMRMEVIAKIVKHVGELEDSAAADLNEMKKMVEHQVEVTKNAPDAAFGNAENNLEKEDAVADVVKEPVGQKVEDSMQTLGHAQATGEKTVGEEIAELAEKLKRALMHKKCKRVNC